MVEPPLQEHSEQVLKRIHPQKLRLFFVPILVALVVLVRALVSFFSGLFHIPSTLTDFNTFIFFIVLYGIYNSPIRLMFMKRINEWSSNSFGSTITQHYE